jgi:hypothetical protein
MGSALCGELKEYSANEVGIECFVGRTKAGFLFAEAEGQ